MSVSVSDGIAAWKSTFDKSGRGLTSVFFFITLHKAFQQWTTHTFYYTPNWTTLYTAYTTGSLTLTHKNQIFIFFLSVSFENLIIFPSVHSKTHKNKHLFHWTWIAIVCAAHVIWYYVEWIQTVFHIRNPSLYTNAWVYLAH